FLIYRGELEKFSSWGHCYFSIALDLDV
ncbi:hypothetical protein PanWU01x14_076000, partial [Parasponia andersonii]